MKIDDKRLREATIVGVAVFIFVFGTLVSVGQHHSSKDSATETVSLPGSVPFIPPPPPPPSYRVLVNPPSDDFGRSSDMTAVYNAVAYWSQNGYDIRVTSNTREANRYVEFIKEWGGPTLGESCVTADPNAPNCRSIVGVGDSGCDNQWTHFDYNTVLRISTHELGHALGLQHSADQNSVMYPSGSVNYADPCLLANDLMHVSAGSTETLSPIVLTGVGVIYYSLVEQESGSVDSWISQGNNCCWAAQTKMSSVSDSARLNAGSYTLNVKCDNWFDTCAVSYKIYRQE